MNNQKNTRLFGNVQNSLFHLRLTGWSVFPLTLVVPSPSNFQVTKNENHTKVKRLFEKQIFTPCTFHSAVLVRTLSVTNKQTVEHSQHTEKPPWAGDKGCAEACAERFSALNFHIHAILKLAPVLSQKSEKMHVVRTFCSSAAKRSTVTLIFYFMILIRAVLPFNEKKLKNLCSFFFDNFTKLCRLSYDGSNSACQN